jgi:hypothetical protein
VAQLHLWELSPFVTHPTRITFYTDGLLGFYKLTRPCLNVITGIYKMPCWCGAYLFPGLPGDSASLLHSQLSNGTPSSVGCCLTLNPFITQDRPRCRCLCGADSFPGSHPSGCQHGAERSPANRVQPGPAEPAAEAGLGDHNHGRGAFGQSERCDSPGYQEREGQAEPIWTEAAGVPVRAGMNMGISALFALWSFCVRSLVSLASNQTHKKDETHYNPVMSLVITK